MNNKDFNGEDFEKKYFLPKIDDNTLKSDDKILKNISIEPVGHDNSFSKNSALKFINDLSLFIPLLLTLALFIFIFIIDYMGLADNVELFGVGKDTKGNDIYYASVFFEASKNSILISIIASSISFLISIIIANLLVVFKNKYVKKIDNGISLISKTFHHMIIFMIVYLISENNSLWFVVAIIFAYTPRSITKFSSRIKNTTSKKTEIIVNSRQKIMNIFYYNTIYLIWDYFYILMKVTHYSLVLLMISSLISGGMNDLITISSLFTLETSYGVEHSVWLPITLLIIFLFSTFVMFSSYKFTDKQIGVYNE